MSKSSSYTTIAMVRAAAAAHGFTDTDVSVHSTFDALLFAFACGTIDATLLVAHGRKTIQPEDFASLVKLHNMLSGPLASSVRSSRLSKQSKQSGGTTNTGSYYSPGDAIDQTAYLYAGASATEGHGGSTTDVEADTARTGLMYNSIGGASITKSRSRSRNTAWTLPTEAVTRILREYRLRFNADVRMTDAAKLYMRGTLQTNMDAVLYRASQKKNTSSKGKSKTFNLTSPALKRAFDGHVLVLSPA